MIKNLKFIMLPLAATMLMLNTGCENSSGGDSSPTPAPTPAPANNPIITRAEYDRIQNGMTYAQVVAIVGSPATDYAERDNLIIAQWINPDGSGASVDIWDGRVTAKTAINLR